MTPRRLRGTWIPERGEVIWIDHNPQAGREMRDQHPFLVLSSATFHPAVGLVVGCAMTSAPYNQGSSMAVDLGPIPDRPDAHSYVLCHQLKSFDWKVRGARPHPMGVVPAEQLQQVQEIVAQILGFCPEKSNWNQRYLGLTYGQARDHCSKVGRLIQPIPPISRTGPG